MQACITCASLIHPGGSPLASSVAIGVMNCRGEVSAFTIDPGIGGGGISRVSGDGLRVRPGENSMEEKTVFTEEERDGDGVESGEEDSRLCRSASMSLPCFVSLCFRCRTGFVVTGRRRGIATGGALTGSGRHGASGTTGGRGGSGGKGSGGA
jgi:hypothetical protein